MNWSNDDITDTDSSVILSCERTQVMMKGDRGQINQLHDIKWGALDSCTPIKIM